MDSSSDDSSGNSEEESQEPENSFTISKINNFPEKSRERYLKTYEQFMDWRSSKGYQTFSEDVFLAYFEELAKTKQASTLLNIYSVLRSTVSAHCGIHINDYENLVSYIRVQTKGYKAIKSKQFTVQDVETFLNDAPDNLYLAVKVAVVFRIFGACRASELVKLRNRDIQKHSDQVMLVNVMKNPRVVDRSFVIQDKYVKLIEKYQALRPPNMSNDRFFIYYRNGKCKRQCMGKNSLSFFPKYIAVYLKLPNAQLYSGHCFKQASELYLSQSGNPLIVTQNQRWRRNFDPVECLEESDKMTMKLRSADATRDTQDSESPMNDAQRPHSSVVDTQNVNIPGSTVEELREVKMEISECPEDDTSVKSDRLSDEEIPPSPESSSPPSARRPPRTSTAIAALERRRLQLDEVRARQLHARESARLRVEERQLEVDEERNAVLRRIADIAVTLFEKTMGNGGMILR